MLKAGRRAAVAATGALVLTLCFAGCARDERTVSFFYDAVCASCEVSQRMEYLAGRVVGLGVNSARVNSESHDVYSGDGMVLLHENLGRLGAEPSGLTLPVLIVGDSIYFGEAAVTERIAELEQEAAR